MKIGGDLQNDSGRDLVQQEAISQHQRVFAKSIYQTWDTLRKEVDCLDGLSGENRIFVLLCSCQLQTAMNIALHLLQFKRQQVASQSHSLFKLSQLMGIELKVQLRLPCQHDLQKLVLSGFEICKQANFFQQVP